VHFSEGPNFTDDGRWCPSPFHVGVIVAHDGGLYVIDTPTERYRVLPQRVHTVLAEPAKETA